MVLKIFKSFISKKYFIVISLYLTVVFLVAPFKNVTINDDFLFYIQVKAFLINIFKLNVLIDPSFISQGILGYIWSLIFGFSIIKLRILTMLCTCVLIYVLGQILEELKIDSKISVLTMLCVAFNPLLFTSSLTFMTDTYFLMYAFISIFFYLKYFSNNSIKFLILGSSFSGLAFLTRQIGLVPFIAFIPIFLFRKHELKNIIKELFLILTPIFLCIAVLYFWPKYTALDGNDNGPNPIFIESKFIFERVFREIPLSITIIAFSLLPLVWVVKVKPKILHILFICISFLIINIVFKFDLFPLGNVFYIEGLYAKTGFRSNLSIFDNVLFKLFLSFVVSFSIVTVVRLLIMGLIFLIRRRKASIQDMFLILCSLGFSGTVIISTDIYDRYFLPLIVVLIVFISKFLPAFSRFTKTLSFFIIGLLILLNIFLNFEYFKSNDLKWNQANKIREITGFRDSILVDGVYSKYTRSFETSDYSGLGETLKKSYEQKCFVQQYTLDGTGFVFNTVNNVETFLEKKFDNPKIYDRKKKDDLPRIKKHLNELTSNEEYFSPLYSIIGKRAFVGSWCTQDAK